MSDLLKRLHESEPIWTGILEKNILDFWITNAIDIEHGGFYGQLDEKGQPLQGATKGSVLNTRILWTFSSAYHYFGSAIYRDFADRAYNYICDFFLDPDSGGIYWELDYNGSQKNSRKQIYAQAFAIYAFAEYYKITRKEDVLEKAIHIYRLIERYSLDRAKGGYIEAFQKDWGAIDDYRLSLKDLNSPKTMNTHLHILEAYTNLFRIWRDRELEQSLKNLLILFLEKFLDKNGHLVLFFDLAWNKQEDFYSFGHDIEFSWLLHEAAEVLNDQDLIAKTREAATKIADVIIREAQDTTGGIIYEYNYVTGVPDRDKHYWPQAEAMVGFLNAFAISGDEKYLDALYRVWDFINTHIIDHIHGEWFLKTDYEGNPYPGLEKAGFWKCPYHNSRSMIELLERIKKTG